MARAESQRTARRLAASLAGAALGIACPAQAVEQRCAGVDVVVQAPLRADARTACEGARAAIEFLAGQGLRVPGPIAVHVVAELPETANSEAIGAYLHRERRAYILTYKAFLAQTRMFELPGDRDLYRSLAAHEVAHVVAAANFAVAKPLIEAQEYVAYVAQLASMAPKLRSRVLAQYHGQGFATDLEMNTAIYLVDPDRFGVNAYRHFARPENGTAFLARVLAGRILAFQPP
ncbi:MAG: hypothetical protein KJ025_20650 [Burkholderiales bacterium]|nr:hypothetical protein [Burkholderiales bacterium]